MNARLLVATLLAVITRLSTAQIPYALDDTLPAPPLAGTQSGTGFGSTVAVDGNHAVVGAPHDDVGGNDSGLVRVFDSATGVLLFALPNPSPAARDHFGASVAISGSLVVVGAPGDDNGAQNAGMTYVFDLGGATPTTPHHTLFNPGPAVNDWYGSAVAISGMRVVVGVPGDDSGPGYDDEGLAIVYDLASATPTVPSRTLSNPNPHIPLQNHNGLDSGVQDMFGSAVSISGTRVVVCTRSSDWLHDPILDVISGRAYVFDLALANPYVPVFSLTTPGPEFPRNFGFAAAISGTRLVIGTPAATSDGGGAYVYDLAGATPTVPVVILTDPVSPTTDQGFGSAVAFSGTRVVVGAAFDDAGADSSGTAYVFDVTSGTPTVPVVTLNNPSPEAGDFFGTSVAISGTKVAAGTPNDDTGTENAGSAYVYELTSGTPAVPAATLSDLSPASHINFGNAVAISGNLVVAGASQDNTESNAGSVHVFDRNGATPAVPILTLDNPDPEFGDQFGFSAAVSGSLVVVGVPYDDTGAMNAGSAYVYDLTSGTPAVPVFTLNNPSPAADDLFGTTVAISGNRVVIGSIQDDTGATNAGSAYVYDLGGGTPTVPAFTLNNPSAADHDDFGWSVSISGTRVVVGAPFDKTAAMDAGSAYVYDLGSGTPTVPVTTLNNPSPAALDNFGNSVAISSTRVVVGTYGDDTGASDAGVAYVYDLTSGTPTVPVRTLSNPAPSAGDQFGNSVSLSGTRIVIGTHQDNAGATDAGSAYVYELSSVAPSTPVAALFNPSPLAEEFFGSSVAIDGSTIAIGTPFDTSTTAVTGAVYLFSPAAKGQLTSPANGSTLASTSLPLTWNGGLGVTSYWIYIGTTVGGTDIYTGNQGMALSKTVAVPAIGGKIYVTLWSLIQGVWQSNVYVFTTPAPEKSLLTSPANGSTLADASLDLEWSAGTGVTSYWIYVGSTPGGTDVASVNAGTSTTGTVTVPQDSGPVYVTLWSLINGVWQSQGYWFMTAPPMAGTVQASLTLPANTTTFGSTSVPFIWDTGTDVTRRDLWVGSAPLGYDLYKGPNEPALTRTLNLPGDGRRIHVTLWSLIGGAWFSHSYYFTAFTSPAAMLTSPADGSTLADASLALTWGPAEGATRYDVYVGSMPMAYDIYRGSQGTSLFKTVTVPTDGRPVYVTLWSLISGKWLQNSYWFTTANTVIGNQKARMTTPVNGSVLPGATATFDWDTGTGVTNYSLYVGTTPGGRDLFSATHNTIRARTLTTLPTDGRKIYVTLWSQIGGVWLSNSYLYTAASIAPVKAEMLTPVPGSAFDSTTVTFHWNAGTGTQYWLQVGRTPGSSNIYTGNQGTSLSKTLTNMPSDGGPVYVKLQSLINGVWLNNEYVYQAALPP